eukprot:7383857-Prymnesium_polylepis.1
MENHGTPRQMLDDGIRSVRWGVVLMHRPWCLWCNSKDAKAARQLDLRAWANDTLVAQEDVVQMHRTLRARGVPVLLTTYAQLLFEPEEFSRRLLRFAPCLEAINMSFVPQQGVDYFAANELKTHGSITGFADSLGAEGRCGYDVKARRCAGPDVYAGLSASDAARAAAVEA